MTEVTQQPKPDSWDGITLEEAVRHAVRTCTLDQIAMLLRLIPEGPKREFYRQVVKDEAGKMRGINANTP